jgi:hypothetical protein
MIGSEIWRASWITPSPAITWRRASVIERDMFEAEVAGEHRAGRIMPWEWQSAFVEGMRALLPDDPEGARLIELAQLRAKGESLDATDAALLRQAEEVMHEHWPDYRRLRAQEERREAVLPVLAFRRFVTGWEGLTDGEGAPIIFAQSLGVVADDVLAQIPPIIIKACGITAYNGQYIRGTEKNLGALSKSGDARKTSGIRPGSRAGGTSRAKSGAKTLN